MGMWTATDAFLDLSPKAKAALIGAPGWRRCRSARPAGRSRSRVSARPTHRWQRQWTSTRFDHINLEQLQEESLLG
jgi:hypothetical protein